MSPTLAEIAKRNAGIGAEGRTQFDQVDDPVMPGYEPPRPQAAGDGVDIEEAFVSGVGVDLRSDPRRYQGHAYVAEVANSETYELNVGGGTASASSDVDATVPEILNALKRSANGLSNPIYTRTLDLDGDGAIDTLRSEGLWTRIVVGSVANSTDYSVTARRGIRTVDTVTITSDSSATEHEIIRDLRDGVNNSSASIEAVAADPDDDGAFEVLYVAPSLGLVDVHWSASSNLTIDATGESTSFPFSEGTHTGSADLWVFPDATTVDFRIWLYSAATGSWSMANNGEFTGITENWREQISSISDAERAAIQILSTDGAVGGWFAPALGA